LAWARGQDVLPTPFYYASSTPFDVQARMVIVGANQSVGEAVVSGDRRALNIDPGLLGSANVRGFSYQKGGRGFVGSVGAGANEAGGGNGLMPTIKSSPSEIEPELSILERPGMVLIAPLER